MFNLFDLCFPKMSYDSTYFDRYFEATELHIEPRQHTLPKNTSALAEIWYLLPYTYPWSDLLGRAKYAGEFAIYKDMATLVADFIPPKALVIPVPGDPKREKQRGYHGPHLICKHLAKMQYATALDYLVKVRKTQAQSTLSRKERLTNLSKAFVLQTKLPLDGIDEILLLDDVVTTGTTLLKCAQAIRRHHPGIRISGLAIAGDEKV
jgi:ComF family protein